MPRLCVLLGLANYHHRFVKNFSLIAKPFTILMKKRPILDLDLWPTSCIWDIEAKFECDSNCLTSECLQILPVASGLEVVGFGSNFHLEWWFWMWICCNLCLAKQQQCRRHFFPMREKRWRRCGPLSISSHISMVSTLLWWLIINLYGGSWSRINLLASSSCGFYRSMSTTLRWYTVLESPI